MDNIEAQGRAEQEWHGAMQCTHYDINRITHSPALAVRPTLCTKNEGSEEKIRIDEII